MLHTHIDKVAHTYRNVAHTYRNVAHTYWKSCTHISKRLHTHIEMLHTHIEMLHTHIEKVAHTYWKIAHTYRNVAHTYRNIAHTYRKVAHTYPNIAHTYRNVAHTYRNVAHTYWNVAHTYRNIAHTYRNVAHTYPNIAHTYRNIAHTYPDYGIMQRFTRHNGARSLLATSVSSFIHNFVIHIIHHLLQFVPWTFLIHRCHQNKTFKLGLLLIASNSDLIIYSTTEQHGNSAQRAPSFLAPRQQRRHNSTSSTFHNIRTYDVIHVPLPYKNTCSNIRTSVPIAKLCRQWKQNLL